VSRPFGDEDGMAPATSIERHTLLVDGLRFDALACGPATGELVLMLHGFPQFADAWTEIMELVADAGYRALAVDQRGYSLGARPTRTQDYATNRLVADAVGFADAVGAQRFHLVGHDWGGALAWIVAAQSSNRLLTLSVLSTPHLDAFFEALRHDPEQQRMSRYIRLFRLPFHIAEVLLLSFNARLLRSKLEGEVRPRRLDDHIRRIKEPRALTAMLNWYRALDPKRRIGKVSVPTLFVWGSKDPALGEAAANATGRYVSGPYRFCRLAGASHWLMDEMPERVAAELIAHLKGRPAEAAT
jgi:pimeloyl-ACP methyl ester carboxylesterase